MSLKLLSQKVAQAIDEELMSAAGGFSVDQLMELAGLSVAQAVQKSFDKTQFPNILVCVGPGNNGGDGLVAARHLYHFGYKPALYYPKQPNKDLYQRLLTQCRNLELPIHQDFPGDGHADVLVDSVFGFSFHGEVRDPFKDVIKTFEQTNKPIVSVDIPSGWDVEQGCTDQVKFQPEVLVSLTAPKMCAKHFKGKRHFLGGRFVPPSIAKKFDFQVPPFPDSDQVVELSTSESSL
ncbi:YjeF N-terminal domain-containing protein [Zychaea mexicana]|uniref:YjeF N-terminal domain-containing protein n=1 Tax=Zychaea mexicana TaxID=64656 RepID=UPI0022FE88B1|nr:YjeF N-terminal domain-containing protein [Zychaea mexicana]KAI9484400.1 YjeF N-terminal domain-containing protein [Zychaea mexicana]